MLAAITFCKQYPIIDVLPVMKGMYFNEHTKLLYYVKAAYIEGIGFLFDLTKFEQTPAVEFNEILSSSDSTTGISFNFTGRLEDPTLTVILNAKGSNVVYADGEKLDSLSNVNAYKGNDEQGWYWGVRFILSTSLLENVYGEVTFKVGDHIKGNVYAKLPGNDLDHFVSITPFLYEDMLSKENHNTFTLVS